MFLVELSELNLSIELDCAFRYLLLTSSPFIPK